MYIHISEYHGLTGHVKKTLWFFQSSKLIWYNGIKYPLMRTQAVLRICEKYGQNHLVRHFLNLGEWQRSKFLKNLEQIDFPLLDSLYSNYVMGKKSFFDCSNLGPPEVISLPKTAKDKKLQEKAKMIGELLLREKKVSCLLVAGGQATRLGINTPKGFYPITPVKRKTFFQLFSEKILAISKKYNTEIPFFIMTNPESKEEVKNFFESQDFFGLKKENVIIFEQDVLPVLTRDGKIIMKNETEILSSPNGHGNSIKKLYDLGILHTLLERGYEYLFYFQVDNPLVKIADPIFLGYHRMYDADVSLKVVRKKSEDEKVGLYVSLSGRPAIIEYSDLDPETANLRDKNGDLIYWAGNTAMHVFSLEFLKSLNDQGFAFPYHVVEKKIYVEKERKEIDVLKFETFVFDCLLRSKKTCALEVIREEEFSPVKNSTGPSSPLTAQKDMSHLFKKWLKASGIHAPLEVQVEISPLFAIDMDECIEKLKGKNLTIERDIYIE
ncbi:MAG: UTP--glucose-1-phosphate uridylyltransferase [Deltaproteobacteria bacterium]|nr:UTP--glucose-1-phosphate uridylyltransferase [Deltaproteobacteria bacterium]